MIKSPKKRFWDFVTQKDRSELPAIPIIVGDHAAYLSGIPVKEVCKSGKKLAEVLENSFHIYNHDLVIVFSDVTVEAEAMGTIISFPENDSPYILKYPDLSKIKAGDPLQAGRLPEILYAAECCLNSIGSDVQICVSLKDPFSLSAQLQDSCVFFRDCIKNPDLNTKILEIALENQKKFLREILKVGCLPLIGAPLSSGSLISPAIFSKFVSPYLKPLMQMIREANLPVMIHICGDTEIIIDEIMLLKPDILSVDQLDIPKNAGRFNGKTLFTGNFSTDLMVKGTTKNICSETKKLIQSVNYPFLPATGCDVPKVTPKENVIAFIKTVREYKEKI